MLKFFLNLFIFSVIFIFSVSSARADLCPDGVTQGCNPNPMGNKANTINIGEQIQGSNLGIPPQTNQPVGTILRNTITLFFTVGGIGTVIYFLWGAVDWILSGGDKEKVSNARKKMTHALIGLAILALSFVIIRVVGSIVGFNPLGPIQIRKLNE